MFRPTIRDLLRLTSLAAGSCGWFVEHRRLKAARDHAWSLRYEMDFARWHHTPSDRRAPKRDSTIPEPDWSIVDEPIP
jgi:hypothetical protein